MSSISNVYKQNKIGQRQKAYEISRADNIISKQVFTDRRNEIHEYLKLFGYKADKTIIQGTRSWILPKERTADQSERESTSISSNRKIRRGILCNCRQDT